MLTDKTILVRKYVLDELESGRLQAGGRMLPARQLAERLGVTFLKVQQALETLVQDGILETRPRQGTFARPGWQQRILHDNLSIFNYRYRLPWLDGLESMLTESLPGLRFTDAFPSSMVEYKVTMYAQSQQHNLMDIGPLLDEIYPDESEFFDRAFQPFRIGSRLVGIPFIYSPRVLYCNQEVFRRAGCELPVDEWDWTTFMGVVERLKRVMPSNRILNWYVQPHVWLNVVKRAGGGLLHTEYPDQVLVDSEETRRGLQLFRELGDCLDNPAYDDDAYRSDFLKGKAAMVMGGRQFRSYLQLQSSGDWQAVPLPLIPGGKNVTSQSTDVICVRNTCSDLRMARDYIRFMLSEQVQDFIAGQKYGIPIRRSSAERHISADDPCDAVFLQEQDRLSIEPAPACPGLMGMLLSGIDQILLRNEDITEGTAQLAQAARTMLSVHAFQEDQRSLKARGADPIAVSPVNVHREMFR